MGNENKNISKKRWAKKASVNLVQTLVGDAPTLIDVVVVDSMYIQCRIGNRFDESSVSTCNFESGTTNLIRLVTFSYGNPTVTFILTLFPKLVSAEENGSIRVFFIL